MPGFGELRQRDSMLQRLSCGFPRLSFGGTEAWRGAEAGLGSPQQRDSSLFVRLEAAPLSLRSLIYAGREEFLSNARTSCGSARGLQHWRLPRSVDARARGR